MRRIALALLLGLGSSVAFAAANIGPVGGITTDTTPSFAYVDEDASGTIDVTEADRVQDLARNIDTFDADGDGELNQEEFSLAKAVLPEMYG